VILRIAALAALTLAGAAEAASYRAEIRRTDYGVPHIKAADFAGLGYGAGYAHAQDNFCEFAERMLTVSGERARHFGAGTGSANLLSDLFHRRLIQSGRLETLLDGPRGSLETPPPMWERPTCPTPAAAAPPGSARTPRPTTGGTCWRGSRRPR
jgi:acyl-homoserine-lactone acylase